MLANAAFLFALVLVDRINPTVMSQAQKMKIMKRTIIISQMIMRTMMTRKRPIGRGVWQR